MESAAGCSSNSDISYGSSRKGAVTLSYEKKQYRKFRKYKSGHSCWRCLSQPCTGYLTMGTNEEIVKITKHTCPTKNINENMKETLETLKHRVTTTDEPIPKIYKNVFNELKDQGPHMTVNYPNFDNIKTGLYKQRNKAHGVDRLFAKYPEDVQVPKKYLDFLLADYKDGTFRILLFATKTSRVELAKTRHIYCDGTFKCVPKPFLQIYSIHGEIDGFVKPLAYALLLNKKKGTYKTLFELLKSTIPAMQLDFFTSDFEEAAVRGFLAVFPNTSVKGCFFHFKKALRKKGKELGLNENGILRKHVGLCSVLPLLPPDALDDAWLYLMSESPDEENVTKFNDYVIAQWIGHKLWSDKWSCYGVANKTNNYPESHYATLSRAINRKSGINLSQILGFCRYNCDNYIEYRQKTQKSKSQIFAAKKNKHIDMIVQEFRNGSITIGHCMEKLRF